MFRKSLHQPLEMTETPPQQIYHFHHGLVQEHIGIANTSMDPESGAGTLKDCVPLQTSSFQGLCQFSVGYLRVPLDTLAEMAEMAKQGQQRQPSGRCLLTAMS